jgi:lipopolysaccharide export system protein LptC
MALELHLPDLGDRPLALGPVPPRAAPPRVPLPWHQRARELLATYLPLLLMGVLALGTWWLVKNTPPADVPAAGTLPREEPDYTMERFVVERFDKDGRLKLRLQGERLRHFAATDVIEIDDARVRAVAADGRVTLAQARRAVANGDGSEVQLIGDARVDSSGPRGEPILFRGEFLHAFLATEQLRSHLPVLVQREGSEFRAAGMEYDHLTGQLQLQGKMRALLQPAGPRSKPVPDAGSQP